MRRGEKFGRWKFISLAENSLKGLFVCDCGTEKILYHKSVRLGQSKSCGCLRDELASIHQRRHGHTFKHGCSPEYRAWSEMKKRCLNRNLKSYARYGGRGIKVCKRWMRFENFLTDLGLRPSQKHSLNRADNNGNYTPKNCLWSTAQEQVRNRSITIFIKYKGKKMTLMDLADKSGLSWSLLYQRIFICGRTPEVAASSPSQMKRRKRHD